ncbi:MAG: OmpA family protein [Bacteroidaceae bacterium]|nr:OmpA family protein [Bacteroidaceae bacterium]
MNVKKFLLSCLTVAAAFSVNAQETEKTENVYVPNWYVQGQFGGQHTIGEIPFTDLNSLNAQIGVGYNFNEIWGTRLTINGWKSKAGWETTNKLTNHTLYETWAWNYVSPMVDGTVDLANWILGYDPNRLVNFGVFAGIGANIAFCNNGADAANKEIIAEYDFTKRDALRYLWKGSKAFFTGRVGANVDFRITNNWAAGFELQANIISDKYNSKRAGNADWYMNALIGVKYTFGKSNTTRVLPVVVPVDQLVTDKVKDVNNEIDGLKKRIAELEECCAESKAVIAEAAEKAKKELAEPFRRDIFFSISSNTIQASELQKIKDVVEYMKKNPDSIVEVTGYADRGTGNPTINAKYAHNRAITVMKALVAEGISSARIKESSMGDRVQPYAEPTLNRVAICIVQ